MAKEPEKTGFTDVDGSDNPEFYVNCLIEQYIQNPVLRRHKQRTLELAGIRPGDVVLDVGCGTGIDALQMAALTGPSGHVFGIDLSREMIASANRRLADSGSGITFRQGDIYNLDFAVGYFDLCRADKTFQHLSDPSRALRELVRVTKPGGRIIIADPDHDSLIIDTPFVDVNHRFARFRSQLMPQGSIAHRLYGMYKELGLVNVVVEPLTGAYTDYEHKKVTSPYLEEICYAQDQGVVTKEEAEKWAAYLREAIENDRFLCLQTYVITTGTKPSS